MGGFFVFGFCCLDIAAVSRVDVYAYDLLSALDFSLVVADAALASFLVQVCHVCRDMAASTEESQQKTK